MNMTRHVTTVLLLVLLLLSALANTGLAASQGFVRIASNSTHSLGLKSDGTVVAWGDDNSFNGGNIPAGLSTVTAIATGYKHSLALKSDGTVVAWGQNESGQATVPQGLTDVIAIAAGDYHSLALKSDGTLVGWGSNAQKQITIPAGLSGVAAIAACGYRSMALKSDGTVVMWGDSAATIYVPSNVSGVIAIATGSNHALALKNDHTVVAWGSNTYGQTTVPGTLSGVVAIAAGANHSLALKDDHTVVAWGNNNCIGTNYCGQATVPANLDNVTAIAGGYFHSLALKSDGTVTSWGDNRYGQITLPAAAQTGVIALDGGGAHSLALKSDGSVSAWGYNYNGQAPATLTHTNVTAISAGYDNHSLALTNGSVVAWGDNTYNKATVPTTALQNIVAIAAGGTQSLALHNNGTVIGWGGSGSAPYNLAGVAAISAGFYHSLALKYDGTVVAWGLSTYGQAVVPSGLSDVSAIAAGGTHSLVLKRNGTVTGWGANSSGQINIPQGLSGVVAIAAGYSHSMALKSDGSVQVWGDNSYGQTALPAAVQSGVVAIASSKNYCLAMKSDGTVVIWGLQGGAPGVLDTQPPRVQHTVSIANTSGLTVIPAASTVPSYEGDYLLIGIPGPLTPIISGCGGTRYGTIYKTAPVTADCTVTIGLAPPLATSVTDRTATSFTAHWNPAAGATGYYLDVASDLNFTTMLSGYNGKDVGLATSSAISGLTAGTTYWYRLRSYNGIETSTNSNPLPVAPLPATPLATSATGISTTAFTANWTTVADATGYLLDVALDSNFTTILPSYNSLPVSGTSSVVTGLTPGTNYWYRLRAVNISGTGAISNLVGVITLPAAPVAITATGLTADGFTANWSTVTGAVSYLLDVSTDTNFNSFSGTYHDLEVPNNASYQVSGLTPGNVYYFRVRAKNASGISAYSNTKTVGTILTITAFNGSGSGTVTSTPAGIACEKGLGPGCSMPVSVASVSLGAAPDWKSVFSSWGGACDLSPNPCVLTMDSDKNVTVTFNPNFQAILAGDIGTGFATLQSAYDAAGNGAIILAHIHDFYEDLNFNQAWAITLDGGKDPNDASYQTTTGYTSLVGTLSIASGEVTIHNIIIK
ncbi:Alpha-tubulin suppressor [Trichlorobacter thiogenes]|uniref:Alpha-tubulin suppressor n=1 Tax=Trichlorobacter thiogenes TaxID=115783 RepID=A0A1T4MXF9_9BACT|nr:fibronectin type III domain-containing protein [Trichlorobacter thiogenes]SJZ71536.1 Alpha-tubulin suppressor [Trichlorobacter thiogenes]